MEKKVEYIDFEEALRKGREFAKSVFTHDQETQIEEGHEFDYMRLYDGYTVDDVVEIKE